MATTVALTEGVIRPSLVRELNWFRAPDLRLSSYYLNLAPQPGATPAMIRLAVKDAMEPHRERIEQLDVSHAARQSLLHDWEAVRGLADDAAGERNTRALAC